MPDRAQVTITHHAQGQGGKYVAVVKGESAEGMLEWEPGSENVRVVTHTIVPRKIGGRGVAAQLVERLVADARRLDFRIDPRCSYAAAKFEENPDWADVRA